MEIITLHIEQNVTIVESGNRVGKRRVTGSASTVAKTILRAGSSAGDVTRKEREQPMVIGSVVSVVTTSLQKTSDVDLARKG